MTKGEMKDKISFALKDPILQQGFEIICKENAELDCQMNRNKYCYSCANVTDRCFRNEIGCPCTKYKSYKDENTELKEKLNIRSCQNCKHNNKSCPSDGSCVHYNKWEGYKNPQLTRAKEIIKKLYSHVFQGMGFMEINDYNVLKAEAEQFLNSEVEK